MYTYHDWMLLRELVLVLVLVIFIGLAVVAEGWRALRRKRDANHASGDARVGANKFQRGIST